MLVDDESYLLHFKALLLSKFLISGIEKSTLPPEILDLGTHTEFIKAVYKAIVYHSSSDIRTLAFENFQLYFSAFSIKGGYRLVMFVMKVFNHSGLIGYMVTQIKNIVIAGLNGNNLVDEFQGQSLKVLVRSFCQLKHKEETDLLEVSDEVMASLNFLICLNLRDKLNETGIRDLTSELQENYLKQVERGLVLGQAHNKQRLADCQDPKNLDSMYEETTLTVGGRIVPIMNREQMEDVFRSALTTFDMMNCVLVQLGQVFEKAKTS